MMLLSRLAVVAALLLPALSPTAVAGPAEAPWDEKAALAASQAAIGRQLEDYEFRDRMGQPVRLSELTGTPLVISLIYTSCHHICPTTTRHLAKVVAIAREALGNDSFRVLTIGFDTPRDNPEAMRVFADQQGVSASGWYFLSADPAVVQRLADQLGFQFRPSAAGFDHLIQASVVDGQGIVYRQVYGTSFDTPLLVEPLKELVYGRPVGHSLLGRIGDRIRLFCTVYDPSSDRYIFDYSLFIGIVIGFGCLALVATFLVREWSRSRRA